MDFRDRQTEERYKNRWFGKYRAFVRDNNDPERLGRVRLEIPAVLGSGRENWSEWAYPCFPYGGNEDIGMFFVPEEGASVWAEFEGGQVQHPIWSGVWLAKSNPGEQPEESKRECSECACLDCEDEQEHQNHAHDHREHTKYHGHPPFYCPRLKVLLKTETGHTILADDSDEKECLKIIDRAGQAFHMEGRVKAAVQTGNGRRRATKDAEKGDQLSIDSDIVDRKGRIEITDVCRQSLRLEAWKDQEKVHLQSCDAQRSRWQKLLMDTTKGREKTHLWGLNGQQEVLIDSTKGSEKVQLTDKAGQVIVMNAAAGRENISMVDKSGQRFLMDAAATRIGLTDRAGSEVLLEGASGNVLVRSASLVLINP
jgi:hypothetical protein